MPRAGLPAGLIVLVSAGCMGTGSPAVYAPLGASFAIAPAVAPVGVASPGEATAPPADPTAREGTVRLFGRARVKESPADAANVSRTGDVTGSPVTISDAATGRRIGRTTTFYDGSFFYDVPLAHGQRAVLATVDLVGRTSADLRAPLAGATLLKAGEGEHSVALSPGTTVLVALLNDLAALDAGTNLSGSPQFVPPGGSSKLATLIASFETDDQNKFAALAEASPELDHVGSVEELGAGIRAYLDRLRQSIHKKG